MKIKKKIILRTGIITTMIFPIATTLSCGDIPKEEFANKSIVAGFSYHADILMGMGIIPKFLADEGMGSKVPYLDKIKDFANIKRAKYINTFEKIDPIELTQLGSEAETIVGSYDVNKIKPYFSNIIKLQSTPSYTGEDAETLTVSTKITKKDKVMQGRDWHGNNQEFQYTSQLNMQPANLYGNWIDCANKMDEIFSQKDKDDSNDNQYLEKIRLKISSIKERIKRDREKLQNKIGNDKTLLIYSWGGRKTPNGPTGGEDFDDLNNSQSVMLPNLAAGSLFYSKKNGLGFNMPKFNEENEIYIKQGSWNSIKGLSNGTAEIRASLKGQNDYVIFSKQLYDGESTSIDKVRESFGSFVKDQTKVNDNLKWFHEASLGSASYGPYGVEYILDWVEDKWDI